MNTHAKTISYFQAKRMAEKIKDILVKLAAKDKLPLDMNELDEDVFMPALNDPDIIFVEWCTDDVLDHAKQTDQKLTKKQAREVLQLLRSNHDAGIGINWDVISDTITSYLNDKS